MEGNSAYVTNLVNSIIGVSVLAMPFCLKQCGLILGLGLLFGAAWLTYISCSMLATSAFHKRRRTYEYLALYTLGPTGKFAVELSMIGMNLGTCVAFYVVIGDLSNGIITKFVDSADPYTLRIFTIVFCGLCIALPLGLMKSLSVLSYFGFFSLMFYCSFLVVVVLNAVSNGLLHWEWFNEVNLWRPAGVFQCLPIFSLAYACQCQLFIVYDSLEEPSVRRIDDIVFQAIKFVTVVYMSVGFFGYTTYREQIAGNLLVSFPSNLLLDFIKLGFAMSVVLGFPLIIFPCRQSIHTLFFSAPAGEGLPPNTYIPPFLFKSITLVIVLSTMVVAIVIPNVETILGLTGATMGSLICFIFPALIYEKASPKAAGGIPKFVFAVGCLLLVVCTYTNLTNTGQDQVKAVEHPIVPGAVDAIDINVHELEGKPPVVVQPPKEDIKLEPDTGQQKEEPKAEVAEVINDEHRHEPANPVDPDNLAIDDKDSPNEEQVGGVAPNEDKESRVEGKQRAPGEGEGLNEVKQPAEGAEGAGEAKRDDVEHPVNTPKEKLEEQAVQQKPPEDHPNQQQHLRQLADSEEVVDQPNVRQPENGINDEPNNIAKPVDREDMPAGKPADVRPDPPKQVLHDKVEEKAEDGNAVADNQENKQPEDKELLEKIKQQHEKQQQLLIEQEELIKKLEEHHDKKEQAAEPKQDEKLALKPDVQNADQPVAPQDAAAPGNVGGFNKEPVGRPHQDEAAIQQGVKVLDGKFDSNAAEDPLQRLPGPNVDGHGVAGRELLSDQKEDRELGKMVPDSAEADSIGEEKVPESAEKDAGNNAFVATGEGQEKKDDKEGHEDEDEPHLRVARSIGDGIITMDKVGDKEPSMEEAKSSIEQLNEGAGEKEMEAERRLGAESIPDSNGEKDASEKDKNQKHGSFIEDDSVKKIGGVAFPNDNVQLSKENDILQKDAQIDSLEGDIDKLIEDCLDGDEDCWRGKPKSRELKSYDDNSDVV